MLASILWIVTCWKFKFDVEYRATTLCSSKVGHQSAFRSILFCSTHKQTAISFHSSFKSVFVSIRSWHVSPKWPSPPHFQSSGIFLLVTSPLRALPWRNHRTKTNSTFVTFEPFAITHSNTAAFPLNIFFPVSTTRGRCRNFFSATRRFLAKKNTTVFGDKVYKLFKYAWVGVWIIHRGNIRIAENLGRRHFLVLINTL